MMVLCLHLIGFLNILGGRTSFYTFCFNVLTVSDTLSQLHVVDKTCKKKGCSQDMLFFSVT